MSGERDEAFDARVFLLNGEVAAAIRAPKDLVRESKRVFAQAVIQALLERISNITVEAKSSLVIKLLSLSSVLYSKYHFSIGLDSM